MAPNITELDAGPLDIRPNEAGVESAARAAYRIGSYGNQQAADMQRVGQEVGGAVKSMGDVALQYMEHREINTAAPHAATISASKDQSWNNYITGKDIDPNDPTRQDQINARVNNPQAAQQWREENLDPDLDKFQESFMTQGGQRWAQDWADKYRNHFSAMAHADQATMAGEVVKANIEKTGNTLATGVFNNPSTLGASFDLLDHSITGNVSSSPTMTPDVATRVTTELKQAGEEKLVQAAVQGAILKGGDWRTIANDPKYAPYIKPAENAAFERQEKFYQRGAEASQKQILLLNKQIAETKAATALNQSWSDNVKFDPTTGRPTINPQFIKDMTELPLRNSDAPNAVEMAKTNLDWAESQQRPPPVHDDPAQVDGLLKTLSDPNTTPDQAKIAIAKVEIAKGMTSQTGTQMRQLATDLSDVKDPVFKDTLQAVRDKFTYSAGNGADDPIGSAGYARFMQVFVPQYLKQMRAGTLPVNALDLRDPQSLISASIVSSRLPLQAALQPPAADPGKAPALPKGYPAGAQWDANFKYWYVVQGGKKFRVDPPAGAQPAYQVPIR